MRSNKDGSHLKIFKELTKKSLNETDVDKVMELLLQRDASANYLVKNNITMDEKDLQNYLVMEDQIIKRLEEERKNLFKEMEGLSKNKKAVSKYMPKFPFPPMPVFLDKKG